MLFQQLACPIFKLDLLYDLFSPCLPVQDFGLMYAQLPRDDEAVHEGPLCSPCQMGHTAGDLPAPQQACIGSHSDTGSALDAALVCDPVAQY